MDSDVEALRRLLGDSVARRVEVAERIGVNDQTLYQILKGIALPSGKPRGVGRKLRDALDAHYPGWREPPTTEPGNTYALPSDPHAWLSRLLDVIGSIPPARWASVRAQLDQLAQRPDMRAEVETELRMLLGSAQGSSRKRTGTVG